MMKTMKRWIALLLAVALLASLAGCTVIMPQRMYRLKGTYKLVQYTVTPAGEDRGAAATEYAYTDYLVITGDSTGYYIHKSEGEPAVVSTVALSYQYAEDSKKIEYVSYGNTEDESPLSGIKLGVARDSLSYSKLALGYTEPFTGREMTTEGITVRFERISRKTDPAYAEGLLNTN